MNMHMQRQTTGMPYLLKDKQCIQHITRPRMGKKRKPACNNFITTTVQSWDLNLGRPARSRLGEHTKPHQSGDWFAP